MKDIGKLAAYFGAVVLIGCLIAPPLYWGGRWLGESVPIEELRRMPFRRYFNRAMLISALVLLVPWLRWCGVRSWRDLGLLPNRLRWRDLGSGFACAALGLWVTAGLLLLLSEDVRLRDAWPWAKLAAVLASALVVPLIEETFFRGAVLGLLCRALSWPRALVLSSVFFSLVHFLKAPKAKIGAVEWWSGFKLLPHSLKRFEQPEMWLPSALTLALMGALLAHTVLRTRSLALAMGLHAGWIWALYSFAALTERGGASGVWFTKDLTGGLAPVLLMGATFLAVRALLKWRDAFLSTSGGAALPSGVGGGM